MASQLIRRMGGHLVSVRDDLAACERLGRVQDVRQKPRAVLQHHMECGDIELF